MTATAASPPTKVANPPLRSWVPTMLLLAVLWGCSFLFIGVGIRELHPTYVTLFRVAAGAVTLLIIMAITRQRLPRSLKLWGHLFVLGATNAVLPFTLFGYGEQHIPSLLAGIWNGTTPLLVLPFAAFLFRTERFTAPKVAGLVVGFLGVLVVLGAWHGTGGADLAGQMMCFAASACYGFSVPYQHRFLASTSESGMALSAGLLISATAQLAVIAPLLAGGAPPSPLDLSPEVIASVLALGILGTGIALALNLRNIRIVGGSTASMVTYIIPVVAVIVGVLVLDEHVYWYQPVGAAVIMLGVAFSQGRFSRRRRQPEAEVPPVVVASGQVTPAD